MKRVITFGAFALFLFFSLMAMEIVLDDEPVTMTELFADFIETALLVGAVIATAFMSIETRELRKERHDLISDLVRARTEGKLWRDASRIHIEGLGKAIQSQFIEWDLSGAETEIASLMLKGLSHKEIAQIRHSSQATIRQQAGSVYRKSGLSSRAELSAFFLEDLLPANPEFGLVSPLALPESPPQK